MTEAWVKRGLERQEFLDVLKQKIMDKESEAPSRLPAQLNFIGVLTEHFARMDESVSGKNPLRQFFKTDILSPIKDFARTDEEALSLIAELFQWECNCVAGDLKHPLQEQEMMHPGKVFGGHGAMDEV